LARVCRAIGRITHLPGGGESRDIWKLGPICLRRWSQRVPPEKVRFRCRVSRVVPVCNSMWYVPWLHWTVARWVAGKPATHEACNRLLARFPGLRDLHPENVVVGRRGAVVVDFGAPWGARCGLDTNFANRRYSR
jgi:hypothetical protein